MASTKSRIAELAAAVAHHTNRVDTYFAKNGLAYPSFEVDSLVEWELPLEIEESRSQALEASQELNDLLQGPRGLIFDHRKMIVVAYLELISRFDIASKVPIDGEVSFASLADMLGFNCAAVTSILRLGIAHRVFREPRPGFIAHSAVSRQLAENTGIASWIRIGVDDMWPACQKIADALVKWPRAEEPNQTAFSFAHGTDQSFYSELGKDPARARRFGEAMSAYIKGDEFSVRHVTDGYGWKSIGAGGTVIYLGGSHGDVAFALARKFPGLHLIVQELPQVVANSKLEDGLDVQFMVHDIFEEQPVHDADVFLFRWILHNWPDSYCVRALRALIPALKPQARVLVVDAVMPPPGLLPNLLDRKVRSMDFMMLALCNAKERTLEEWTSLFAQADPRFNFRGVKQPPGSKLSILEVVWEG